MAQIEGRNPVREALRAGRLIHRLVVAEGAIARGALSEILGMARRAGVPIERVPRSQLDARAQSRSHQGIIAEVEAFRFRSWREGLTLAGARGEAPLVLALDGLTDPQNVGSLMRSAEAFGAHAVLLPSRRAAPITAAVEKASAGALEHLVVDRVANLERGLAECKKEGLWVVGLDAEAERDLRQVELLSEPVVLAVGSEGTGLSRLVRDRADALARIAMAGAVGSLNAAVAGAVALYEARLRRAGDSSGA